MSSSSSWVLLTLGECRYSALWGGPDEQPLRKCAWGGLGKYVYGTLTTMESCPAVQLSHLSLSICPDAHDWVGSREKGRPEAQPWAGPVSGFLTTGFCTSPLPPVEVSASLTGSRPQAPRQLCRSTCSRAGLSSSLSRRPWRPQAQRKGP